MVEFLAALKELQARDPTAEAGKMTVWISLMPPSETERSQNYTGCKNASELCPAALPFPYGTEDAGYYCCDQLQGGSCPGKHCCVAEGLRDECQGVRRCGTNPHNYTVCPRGYQQQHRQRQQYIQQVTTWAAPGMAGCSVPADSPLTPFNESALVDHSKGWLGCNDYVGWSDIIGRLAKLYPALVALNIDDFSQNLVAKPYAPSLVPFTPAMLGQMQANLKKGGVQV